MISCIVPTRNRLEHVRESVDMFKYQTYRQKEMIIVDDSSKPVDPDTVKQWRSNRITYIYIPEKRSIGEKRNIAIQYSKGDYIAIWDDDDFHGKKRLEMQIRRIQQGYGLLTCVKNVHVNMGSTTFTKASAKSKVCVPSEDQSKVYVMPEKDQQRLWYKNIVNNSLLFPKVLWNFAKFPHKNIAEDSMFLKALFRMFPDLPVDRYNVPFVYNRSRMNTWKFKHPAAKNRKSFKCVV